MTEAERKDVENCICSLLTSNPVRMTIQDLSRDFRDMIGYAVPFKKFGFDSFEAYLRSIPTRVLVIGTGNFAEVRVYVSPNTSHINDLICKQKVNKTPRNARNGLRKFVTPRVTLPQPRKPQQKNDRNANHSDRYANSSAGNENYPYRQTRTWTNTNFTRSHTNSSHHKTNSTHFYQNTSKPETSTPLKSIVNESGTSSDEDDCLIPFGIKTKLKNLVVSHPEGVLCSKIPGLYMEKYNHELNYTQYGYRSVAQVFLDMPSMFKYQRCSNGDLRVFDSSVTLPEKPASPPPTPTNSELSDKSSKKKNSVPALPDNIDEVLISMHIANIPRSCAVIFNIERQWIGPQVKPYDYLDVIVADVYDPSKFWIILKEHFEELNELMDDMQDFYRTFNPEYQVPMYAIRNDLYVVCKFSREYHRAKIVDASKKQQSIVKVYFIDYGTSATVYTTGLMYLDKAFTELPAQAVRARLHGIQPVVKDEFWSREASLRFLELVKRKEHLVAQVMWIDPEELTLDIILADTSVPDEDFYVNDALVAEGFGRFLDEVNPDPLVENGAPAPSTKKCLKPKDLQRILSRNKTK